MKPLFSILTLGLCLWSLPALATPSHPTRSRAPASRFDGRAFAELRLAMKGLESSDDLSPTKGTRSDWRKDRSDVDRFAPRPTGSGSTGAVVPEPTALMLFGVGALVVLQAMPRRRSASETTLPNTGGVVHE